MRSKITTQAEDYLKALHHLEVGSKVNTQALADELNVAPASVTQMLKKLSDFGLVIYQPYQGTSLSEAGRKIALEIIRHHRLLETYLYQALGYALEDVHTEAEKLEHHISEDFEARIATILGNPTHDPHGNPIPSHCGVMPPYATKALSDVSVGQTIQVGRVKESDSAFVQMVVQVGLTPGAQIRVLEVNSAAGIMVLKLGSQTHTLGLEQAKQIFVEG